MTGKPNGSFADFKVTVSKTRKLNYPIGTLARAVIGHKLAVNAISRWQPALCAEEDDDTLYRYPQISDDVAPDLGPDGPSPGLALITNLIPTARAPPDRPLTQSYRHAVVGLPACLQNNFTGLTVNPQLFGLNREYRGVMTFHQPADVLGQWS